MAVYPSSTGVEGQPGATAWNSLGHGRELGLKLYRCWETTGRRAGDGLGGVFEQGLGGTYSVVYLPSSYEALGSVLSNHIFVIPAQGGGSREV